MGKLLALELHNFKSYKGHHVLQFGDSYFTSIIGPNGSGKSNSMDAISFVLGIKSSHLRSTHLKDLVYRGRVLKHSKIDADGDVIEDDADAPVNGDAGPGASSDEEADIQASRQPNDPQTAWVMAVFEDDAGEEQRWRRTINASGQSEYRINNRPVTAKVYNESLEAENILIKARNFLVFQGDVEAIASQSPRDLTRLIEQISGSLEFKNDYEKLKAEKEKADEEQAYKLNLRRGINGEIKQYQQQKEELDKFEQMREEKDQAVVTHLLWKLFHFQRVIEDSTAEIQKHQAELKEFRRNVQKFEDRLEAAKSEQAKVHREVSKCERDIKRQEKEVEEKDNMLVPIDEKRSIHSKKLKTHQARIQEIGLEYENQRKFASKLRKDLATVEAAQKRWESEWEAEQQQAGRQISDRDIAEHDRLRKDVYKRTGNAQNRIDNISRQLKTDEETVKSLKSKLDSSESIGSRLTAEIEGLQSRRDEIQSLMKETGKEIDWKQKAVYALISDRDRTDQKKRELDEKLHSVLVKLQEAQGAQRETRKEAHQREMVAQLKRIFPGVRGLLGQLCRPKQKKYDTAVSTVLGRHYDAVVVDSNKTATECIAYLKEQRLGVMTMIPLDTISHKQPNANLRGLHQGMRLAIDTIDFDSSLERAMSFACGDAIVTDTISIARTLCYQKGVEAKAVALDGTVIHKGGKITGGEGPLDRKRRFDDAEVENLRNLADKFRGDLAALPKGHKRQTEEEQLQFELNGLKQKQEYAADEVRALDQNIRSKTAELQHAQTQVSQVRPKYAEQARGLETLGAALEEQTAVVGQVEDEVYGDFCRRLGFSDIRQYERLQGALQEEANQRKTAFKKQIGQLVNQLSFEDQRVQSNQRRLAAEQDKQKRDQELFNALEAEKQDISDAVEEINEAIEESKSSLETLRKGYEERGEKVGEARREVQKRQKGVEKTLKEVSALEAEIQKASASRYGALRTCKVENVRVPLERGSRKIDALPLEDAMLEDDEDAMDVDGDELVVNMPKVTDYGIQIDYSTLDDEMKENDDDEFESTLTEAISNLQISLDKMAPNMRSAERLEATSERLKATDQEFHDSRSMARTAGKHFEEVRQKRMELFNKAFSHISEQIGAVYRELTKTVSFPLGGSASLDVEDEDEPYLSGVKYHAMPPLKRFRDMEHLSGGEKTMAALALLFAVHTYAPSPFFVLDEVDAALDHANTIQLAQYLRDRAGPGMQFVVISLKSALFQNSETLVGVMRDQAVNSSRALTLDLRRYQTVAAA